ncbi:MAG: DUF4347 domain-containing protein, partial [Planctomycetes bacterium]|nr:DUF4347 domain-containing protein [Planctomycetota bacterium]
MLLAFDPLGGLQSLNAIDAGRPLQHGSGSPADMLQSGTLPTADDGTVLDTTAWESRQRALVGAAHEVVFVDGSVEGYESLVTGLSRTAATSSPTGSPIEVILLDADRDGVTQITEYLAGAQGVSGIHILSHGYAGGLQVGSASLSDQSLMVYSAQLARWGESLAADADILIYGCEVAGGAWGARFIEELAAVTGADVAASVDVTGPATLGGNWNLEYATGEIESTTLFSVRDPEGFGGILLDIEGSNNRDTFQINQGNVRVEDTTVQNSARFDPLPIPRQNVSILGKDGNDDFTFNAIPQVDFQGSLLDGGAGTDTVYLGQLQGVTLTIPEVVNNQSAGIKIAEGGNTAFRGVSNIEEYVSGAGDNTYEFGNLWNWPLTIDNTNGTVGTGTLDFSAVTEDLTVNVVADNGGVPTGEFLVHDTGDEGTRPVTADGVATVAGPATAWTTLDLSAINAPLTLTIGAGGSVSFALTVNHNVRNYTVQNVDTIILGQQTNALAFRNGGSIASVRNPTTQQANYGIRLDYTLFGQAPKVNLGTALDLSPGELSVLAADNNANPADAQAATWELVRADAAQNAFALSFGGAAVQINLGGKNAGEQRTEIKNKLESLANVPQNSVVVNGDGTFISPWSISIPAFQTDVPELASASSAASLTQISSDGNNTTWALVAGATGGSFKLGVRLPNNMMTETEDVSYLGEFERRFGAPSEIVAALTNAGINGASVTGVGTADSPWRITVSNNNGSLTRVFTPTATLTQGA